MHITYIASKCNPKYIFAWWSKARWFSNTPTNASNDSMLAKQCITFETDCFFSHKRNQIPIYRVYCLFYSFHRMGWLINSGLTGVGTITITTRIRDAINLDFSTKSPSPYLFYSRRFALSIDYWLCYMYNYWDCLQIQLRFVYLVNITSTIKKGRNLRLKPLRLNSWF